MTRQLSRLVREERASSAVVGPIVVVIFFTLVSLAIGLGAVWVGHVEAEWAAQQVAAAIEAGLSPPQGTTYGLLENLTWTVSPLAASAVDGPGPTALVEVRGDLGGIVPVTSAVTTVLPSQIGGSA